MLTTTSKKKRLPNQTKPKPRNASTRHVFTRAEPLIKFHLKRTAKMMSSGMQQWGTAMTESFAFRNLLNFVFRPPSVN
jgi:hypothetical protein